MIKNIFLLVLFLSVSISSHAQESVSFLRENTTTNKPWTRWWWMGNALDKKNIKSNLIELNKAGLGGVEITPLYGVKGEEENFIEHLSPKWLEMLEFTIHTADSLGMQVDMVLGTGWPYGGPQVSKQDAATKLVIETYKVDKNDRLKKYIQPSEKERSAELKYLLAYGDNGKFVDITSEVKQDGSLNWKAKRQDYTLYAVFVGKTGQKVKRAAPGGKGFTLDHYSESALENYLVPYNKALENYKGDIRAIFNDSFEVYGSNFTPDFFKQFEKYRGYDLKKYLPLLLSDENNELGNRIKSDYRETLSDLLLNKFNLPWTEWAHSKNFKTKLQAHGSPGNLIDLYASADIPECETFGSMPFDIPGLRREEENIRNGDADPVMLKFSSSAAHISGKKLVSSESFTWLREHFKTALSQAKPEAEELFLNGVNHIFLHGTTYSPQRAAWPGWKFYASVNFSPNNTIWKDAPEFFSYLANCQQVLQAGQPDNDVLVYWPIYDIWGDFNGGSLFFQFKIHSIDQWLLETSFYQLSNKLIKKGYGIDFISDSYLEKVQVKDKKIVSPGGTYKSLVIPKSLKMPLSTMKKLIDLKEQGASIIIEGLPESVPGFKDYKAREEDLQKLIDKYSLQKSNDVQQSLHNSNVFPEILVNTGLKYIRRTIDGEKIYFLVNHTSKVIDEFLPIRHKTDYVTLYDPLRSEVGKAKIKPNGSYTEVKVHIRPGESLILKTGKEDDLNDWSYYEPAAKPTEIIGKWKINFLEGGPKLPDSTSINHLKSWAELNENAENFSGTASYETEFELPLNNADNWLLDLGDVRESAQIWLNDKYVGSSWSVPHKIKIGKLNKGENKLKIEVTNLAANRIRAKEMRGEEWKIFHEINMVNKDYKEFDATKWPPTPSGLLGPVLLIPLQISE